MSNHQKACTCYLKFHIKTNHHILSSWFLIIIYSLDQVTIKSRHNGKQSHHTNRGKIDDITIKYISHYIFESHFGFLAKFDYSHHCYIVVWLHISCLFMNRCKIRSYLLTRDFKLTSLQILGINASHEKEKVLVNSMVE